MNLQSSLYAFIALALYPAWHLAAAADYWCHRRTNIESTTGTQESWLHLAEHACIVLVVALATFWVFTGWVLGLAAATVIAHTALSYVDVKRTVGRRFISASEQHAHAVTIVVPIVAVALLGIMEYEFDAAERRRLAAWQYVAVLLPLVIGGALIAEEVGRGHARRKTLQV